MRHDLKAGMPRGKEIAQGAHASGKWLAERLMRDRAWLVPDDHGGGAVVFADLSQAEHAWMAGGFTKVTCQVDSLDALLEVEAAAKAAGVQCHVITDAGLTVFPGPTITCLAVGPDWEDKVDEVTGKLRLY